MEFVDRIDEQKRLREAIINKTPALIVIYGRRRLGKSTLIKKVMSDNDVYFLADRSESQHQRRLLANVISQNFTDFNKATYPDWESLFLALNHRTTDRFTLWLDELPYLAEQSPELPSVLQKIVDSKELKYNIAVCGSSQNMMYGLFLDSTSPLYGRANVIMKLKPITIPYLQNVFHIDAVRAVEEYAVWGGVPRYWELRENKNSFEEALWQNVFSVNGALYEEPVKLLQDDVNDIVKTSTIMSYIGAGANRMSEIASRSNQPATNLSRPLKKLIDLGFLKKDVPFASEEKNSRKSLYKISDPFMSFYFEFVIPNRTFIELNRRLPIELALKSGFSKYVGMQWETLCRDAVSGNIIDDVLYGEAHRWWGTLLNQDNKPEQVEFDVIAESIDKKYLLVGECKWTSIEDATRLTADLRRKASLLPFAKRHIVVPKLFLKNSPIHQTPDILLPSDIIPLFT